MPDPTPAAAAPATPAAAPAAPAPASAPAAVAPAAATPVPAAPAAPETPPAASAAPVEAVDSLLPADAPAPVAAPQTEAEKLAAARELIKKAEEAADPNGGKAWLLTDGVMGQGEKPAWLNTAKYKSVAAQAEAYAHLEQRFGAFQGAPKDGKYEFKPPEGIEVSMDHPLMQDFNKWAASKQLSQEGYSEILGMLVQYEAAQQPRMDDVKAKLGDNVDGRISNAAAWAKANLGSEGYALFRDAVSVQGVPRDQQIASVFKLVETLIGKTGQVRMPKPGADTPAPQGGDALKAIQAMQAEKLPNGQRRYAVDPVFRAEVEKRYREYYANAA